MGLDRTLAHLIAQALQAHPPPPGPVATLGVQRLHGCSDPFAASGLGPVESLDVSDYEGCARMASPSTPRR